MNQDSSFPPMLPPSTELGALLFAVLPCLQETYRPLVSFAYHITELTKLKTIPSIPPLSRLSGIDVLITDKDILLRSLSFYGKIFRMPLLSTIATLLQGMQFYQTYKDILPALFSSMGTSDGDSPLSFGNMAGLFSGLSGLSGLGNEASDLFSSLGGLSPNLLSSLLSGFSGNTMSHNDSSITPPSNTTSDTTQPPDDTPTSDSSTDITQSPEDTSAPAIPDDTIHSQNVTPEPDASAKPADTESYPEPSGDLYDSLYSFLTPEQQKIYEQLLHTD